MSAAEERERSLLEVAIGEASAEEVLEAVTRLGDEPAARVRATEYRVLGGLLGELRVEDALLWHTFATPFGDMYVAATAKGLARVSWQQPSPDSFVREMESRFPALPVIRDPGRLAQVEHQLREYFAGMRVRFELPVDLAGLGDFQRSVLEAVRGVPFGQVIPYAELARRIRRPGASRAVGNALGRNPVGIVVPCHRVIRGDGSLGGYGGGVEFKERLLALEGREDLLRAG